MHFLTLATSALLLGVSVAGPRPNNGHIRHEKRIHGNQLVKRHRAPPATILPVRIGISQTNLDVGHERLMEISDPTSDRFGQHMSAKEVGELFRPSSESIESVRDWLNSSGIDTDRHQVSAGQGWLKFEATILELESLLYTKYHVYQHAETMEEHIGCEDYHVPHAVHPHIDFITPSVSTIKVRSGAAKRKRANVSSTPHIKAADISVAPNADDGTEIPCHTAVTPDCIRNLYGIPQGTSNQTGNEIGIYERGDYYDQADLDQIFAVVAPNVPQGTHPTLEGIDGGTAPLVVGGEQETGVESLLDMALIIPLVYPQGSVLFQVDDFKEVELPTGDWNTFLDALDSSYCTFEGGDDPSIDPVYPDTGNSPISSINGTWDKPEMCGAYKPTNVISVSYTEAENSESFFYWNRQCTEYMKLGLQGVTVVYASGDYGVSQRGGCIGNDAEGDPGAFSPSFPATCPYLTVVGATQINDDDKTETAVGLTNGNFFSGGGFSNYWPAPSYQETTLADYFTDSPPPYDNLTAYGTPFYNKTGRAYPDVAAVGQNILIYVAGEPYFADGTSASAPIFASIITLINEQRLAVGKGTVGFINPTLYQNPDAFTDITTGSNPGCGTEGFSAVTGWDPVTGLGTPIFDKLLDVFMALP
ncbi:Sedolisin-A [Hyphodiscus hymeniophilus]|uniref:Sedolisin-A n=1 Tax=Hyphodiscus hymeniophilus TaxID=353542 RepID=A0A9P7B0B0_9HELO|nr:Sedolisin-A [Hyphodiscus hymeniophilus]